jgi:hypothetical protein
MRLKNKERIKKNSAPKKITQKYHNAVKSTNTKKTRFYLEQHLSF